MDLFVSIHCPQCGAQISFEEESTVIHCDYCGSSLHVTGRSGILRHYIEPRENVPQLKKSLRSVLKGLGAKKVLLGERQLCFAPYWRIKGMVYRWIFGQDANGGHVKELKAKRLDRSFPAYQGIDLGLRSLGVRPRALTLPFFDRKKMSSAGFIMPVDLTWTEAVDRESLIRDVGLDETNLRVNVERTRLMGERHSLVYFPFWIMRLSLGTESRILIVDAVANTVTRTFAPAQWRDMWADRGQDAAIDFGAVSFIAFTCPNCGWDLPLNRFDVIHFCKVCKRAWIEHGGRFRRVKFQIADTPKRTGEDLIYLPFWSCQGKIQANGRILKTAGDLKAFANPYLPPIQAKPDGNPLRLFVPAARIRNILAADKLAAGLTKQQPVYHPCPADKLDDLNALGTFLSPRTAGHIAELLLCSLTPAGNRARLNEIRDARLQVRSMHLLLWPFYGQRLFLRDALCGLGIQKGTLGLSG